MELNILIGLITILVIACWVNGYYNKEKQIKEIYEIKNVKFSALNMRK